MSKKKNKSNKVNKSESAPVVEAKVVDPIETPKVKEEVVKLTSTDIKIISNADLNFKSLKLKRGEEMVVSNSVLEEHPNLTAFIERGVVKIVK